MNPLKGKLTRSGFLVWTLAYIVVFFTISIWFIEASKANQLGIVVVLIYSFIFALPIAAAILLNLRLKDCGWPTVLAISVLIPVAALPLWIVLFFVPSFQRSGSNKSLSEKLSDKWYGRA